jgi:O-6-methylguanine DNA methyltransferase
VTEFTFRVLATVRRIPPGRVATYGDIAAIAGKPGAARAVGNIMRDCSSRDVPAHRVIAAAGRLGGYGGNIGLKRALLEAEGIPVRAGRIRQFEQYRWAPGRARERATGVERGNEVPASDGARGLRGTKSPGQERPKRKTRRKVRRPRPGSANRTRSRTVT